MTIKEIKKMIAEEYRYWMAEQPSDMDMPDLPAVKVGAGDVDPGGEDAEATLKDIFDMLKDYFEGEEGMTPETPSDLGDDLPTDKPAAPKAPKAPKPAAPKPAPKSTPKPDAKDDAKKDDKKDDDKEDKKDDKDELKERFKKLANIIKG